MQQQGPTFEQRLQEYEDTRPTYMTHIDQIILKNDNILADKVAQIHNNKIRLRDLKQACLGENETFVYSEKQVKALKKMIKKLGDGEMVEQALLAIDSQESWRKKKEKLAYQPESLAGILYATKILAEQYQFGMTEFNDTGALKHDNIQKIALNHIRVPILETLHKIESEKRRITPAEAQVLIDRFEHARIQINFEHDYERLQSRKQIQDALGSLLDISSYRDKHVRKHLQFKKKDLQTRIGKLKRVLTEDMPEDRRFLIKGEIQALEQDVKHCDDGLVLCKRLDDIRHHRKNYEKFAKSTKKELKVIRSKAREYDLVERYYAKKKKEKSENRSWLQTKIDALKYASIKNGMQIIQGNQIYLFAHHVLPDINDQAIKHGGKLIMVSSQSGIPTKGSSGGMCYGFSHDFTDRFHRMDEGLDKEQTLEYLSGANYSNESYHKMRNHLGLSTRAFALQIAQYRLPPADVVYEDKMVDDKRYSKKERREHFCREIINQSKKRPCTFMVGLQTPKGNGSGHAIGIAVNDKGIFVDDSNFGRVYFDSDNPDYEKNFQSFFADHIKTHYPDLQGRYRLSNTGVRPTIQKGLDGAGLVTSGLKTFCTICYGFSGPIEESAEYQEISISPVALDHKSFDEISGEIDLAVDQRIDSVKNQIHQLQNEMSGIQSQIDSIAASTSGKIILIEQEIEAGPYRQQLQAIQAKISACQSQIERYQGVQKYLKVKMIDDNLNKIFDPDRPTVVTKQEHRRMLQSIKYLADLGDEVTMKAVELERSHQLDRSKQRKIKEAEVSQSDGMVLIRSHLRGMDKIPKLKNPSPASSSLSSIGAFFSKLVSYFKKDPPKKARKAITNQLSQELSSTQSFKKPESQTSDLEHSRDNKPTPKP